MAKRTKKIKQWVIDAVVENVKAGRTTLDSIDDAGLLQKVRAAMVASSKPEPITLTGTIKRETDKAILFRIIAQDVQRFGIEEAWFPKSQIQIYERAMGPCDQIEVPEWLVESKKTA